MSASPPNAWRRGLELLFDPIWIAGVRVRDLGKKLGISGPIEPLLMRLGPRLMAPPKEETHIALQSGVELWLPPHFQSYRSYLLGSYERDLLALLPAVVKPGDTVVDVGANVGFYTIVLSKLVGDGGSVFAFEADAKAFAYLERNVAENKCSNVITVNRAVTSRPGRVRFIGDEFERGFVTPESASQGGVEVEGISLDSYFGDRAWPSVGLVKIDIEGGELLALQGAVELSKRNSDLLVVVERNVDAMTRAGTSERAMFLALEAMGYSSAQIVERSLKRISLSSGSISDSAMYNLLLDKADR